MKKRWTTYAKAMERCGSLVLCNNIKDVDYSIFENADFDKDGEFDWDNIYQFWITDCNKYDVERLEKVFGLLFTYSDMLDCYILCVTNFGTSRHDILVRCKDDTYCEELLVDYESQCPEVNPKLRKAKGGAK